MVFVAMFAPLAWIGLYDIYQSLASKGWPKTPGVVERSQDHFVVRYHVGGRDYKTSRLAFDDGEDPILEINLLRFPNGASVQVSYSPSAPDRAVVRPGLRMAGLLPFTIGFTLAAFFAGMGLRGGGSIGPLFGGMFTVFGAILLLAGGINVYRAYSSLGWPKTAGRIIVSRVDAAGQLEDPDDRDPQSFPTPVVAFRYEVDGRPHYSFDRHFGQAPGSHTEEIQAVLSQYPEGSPVTVTYDPEDPDRGVLEPGITWESTWLPGAGAVAAGIGLFCIRVMRRRGHVPSGAAWRE